jgi:hypothetical protein
MRMVDLDLDRDARRQPGRLIRFALDALRLNKALKTRQKQGEV